MAKPTCPQPSPLFNADQHSTAVAYLLESHRLHVSSQQRLWSFQQSGLRCAQVQQACLPRDLADAALLALVHKPLPRTLSSHHLTASPI